MRYLPNEVDAYYIPFTNAQRLIVICSLQFINEIKELSDRDCAIKLLQNSFYEVDENEL